jgi:hypothetical protein
MAQQPFEVVDGKFRTFDTYSDFENRTAPDFDLGMFYVSDATGDPNNNIETGGALYHHKNGILSKPIKDLRNVLIRAKVEEKTITDNYIIVDLKPVENTINVSGVTDSDGVVQITPFQFFIEEFNDDDTTRYRIYFDKDNPEVGNNRNGYLIWLTYEVESFIYRGTDILNLDFNDLSNDQILKYNTNSQQWNNVSLKTINNQSLFGDGNIEITGGTGDGGYYTEERQPTTTSNKALLSYWYNGDTNQLWQCIDATENLNRWRNLETEEIIEPATSEAPVVVFEDSNTLDGVGLITISDYDSNNTYEVVAELDGVDVSNFLTDNLDGTYSFDPEPDYIEHKTFDIKVRVKQTGFYWSDYTTGSLRIGQSPIGSLIAFYTFDNVSGNTLVDEMGNYDGTISGMTTVDDGTGNMVGSFDGSNDSISISKINVNAMSVFTEIKRDSTSVMEIASSGTSNYILYISSTELYIRNNANSYAGPWSHSMNTTDTYKVLLVLDGTNAEIFIDGVSLGSKALSGTYSIDTIGKGYNSHFNGTIDNFAIWDKALTQEEITLLQNNKLSDLL